MVRKDSLASEASSGGDKNEHGLHTNNGIVDNEHPDGNEFKKQFATVSKISIHWEGRVTEI